MITLAEEPKILSMAHALGIHEGDPVEGIMDFCRRKVRQLLEGATRVALHVPFGGLEYEVDSSP